MPDYFKAAVKCANSGVSCFHCTRAYCREAKDLMGFKIPLVRRKHSAELEQRAMCAEELKF